MLKRETRREIPTSDRIFGIKMSRGVHAFRVPGRMADAPIGLLGGTPPLMGAIIGLGWLHVEYDLEAVAPAYRADKAEWLAYGDAVLMELDDADYLPAEVDGVAGILLREWTERIQIHGEAREKADFFEVTMGELRSLRSTSRSGTLAVVADSAT